MAITWGAWSSNNRLRCGVEVTYSPTSITSATTQVTVTRKVYLQTRYASNETGSSPTWYFTGSGADISGNTDWNLGDMGILLMGQDSETLALVYGSTQTWSQSGRIHSYFAYPGTEATATQSITIPARPVAVPVAPSAVGAVRVSDTSHTISWTRNVSTGAPYDNIYVERWDNVTNTYAIVATLAGTATSYSNTTTVADRQYRWRVRARNSAGYSGYNYSGYLKTTPAPPGTPTATKTSGGDINLAWTGNSPIAEQIEVWHAANGVWDGAALATIAVGTTYTHVAPNAAQTHKYRLKSKIAVPALTSANSGESNTVQLQAPPNAPTNLAPSGVTRDADENIILTWQHNPVDTTPQRKKQIQYRIDGGAWTQTAIFTDANATHTVNGGSIWTNGHTIEWQVRTWGTSTTAGSDGTGASPWSASATLVTSTPPTVTINEPDGVSPLDSAEVEVVWGYFDAESQAQGGWDVKLLDDNGAVLEAASGSGTQTSYTFGTQVLDGSTYEVQVQVRDSVGALSDIASQEFSVEYAPPPTPQAEVEWDEPSGTVSIDTLVSAPGAGEVAAVKMRVFRSLDEGATWVLVGQEVDPGSSVVDYIPPLNRDVLYKVQAVSATPSIADSATVSVFTDSRRLNRVWLNVGTGFERGVFLSPECHVKPHPSAGKELQTFAGREYPVEFASRQRSNIIDVSGVIVRDAEPMIETSTWDEIEDAVLNYGAPACLRDLRGHRWFVSTNDPQYDGPHKIIGDVSYQCRVVDYREPNYEEVTS